MAEDSRYHVFLSHNSADKPAVEELARRLVKEGIQPWLDKWNLDPRRAVAGGHRGGTAEVRHVRGLHRSERHRPLAERGDARAPLIGGSTRRAFE